MTAEFEKNEGEYIEVPDDRTESEKEYDRQIERLDSFFSGIQPGVTLLVERLKPSWCSGLLEEITVNDEVIDLGYFIENWGGQLLSVKVRAKGGHLQGSYKVPLHSYPPLRYGEKIYPYDKGERFKEGENNVQGNSPVVVTPPQSQSLEKIMGTLPAILPFVLKWLESAETRRQHDMALMMQMMKGQSGGGGGGIADISKLGAVMAQLNEVFRKNNAGENSGEMDFIPQALEVLKMVMAPQEKAKGEPTKGRLTPPRGGGPPPAMGPQPVAKVTPLPSPSSSRDLAGSISDMSPDKAAETIIEALGRMDAGKREAAIGHFMGEYSETMEDESGFEGDDEQEDDDQRGAQ